MMNSALEFENPGASRITITRGAASTDIIIPPRRSIFTILFICFWLVGWGVGAVSAGSALVNSGSGNSGGQLFLLAWLAAWLLGGFAVLASVIWMLVGKEHVTVTQLALTHNYKLFIRLRQRNYRSTAIDNIRWIDGSHAENRFLDSLRGSTSVEFDYGPKSLKLAFGTDAGEGKAIIEAIQSRISGGRR